jgi:kynurenine formamidase
MSMGLQAAHAAHWLWPHHRLETLAFELSWHSAWSWERSCSAIALTMEAAERLRSVNPMLACLAVVLAMQPAAEIPLAMMAERREVMLALRPTL